MKKMNEMKKILCGVLLCALFPFIIAAGEVSREDAIRVAADKCSTLAGDNFHAQVKQVRLVEKDGQNCYYIIHFQPEGWALVSADDRAKPVLAYSPAGLFYEDQQPPAMQWLLDQYADAIRSLASRRTQRKHPAWDSETPHLRAAAKIEPLIQVNWNQSGQYNKACPVNTKGERALVGCVAVAMAQAMSVFQKPDRPVGRNGYTDSDFGLVSVNYDREAPYDWDAIMNASNANAETARLLFHCGVAVNMDYGKDGSGSYCNRIPNALKTYFSYPSTVSYYRRNSYSGDWIALITEELSAGRPVVYDGTNDMGTSAHAFNLDGFDGSDSFHVNWGWGGRNNAYFTLENLNDGNFNYLNNHGVVVGIESRGDAPHTEAQASPTFRLYAGADGAYTLEAPEAGRYRIYDLRGNQISGGTFQAGRHAFHPADALAPAVCIVAFSYGNKETTQKIIINK
jgi:hypothetical protein